MNSSVFRVVLRLSSTPFVHDWLAFDATGQQCGHGSSTPPAATTYELAIPAAWLTAHRIAVPAVSEKQRSQLIAQALEDRVLGKLADYQWVSSAVVDGVCTVWVLELTKVAQLKAWVAEQSIPFSRWIPEFALLPGDLACAAAAQGLMLQVAGEAIWLADDSELLALPLAEPVQRIATSDLLAPAKNTVSFYRGKSAGVSPQIRWIDWRLATYLLAACVAVMVLSLIIQWRSLANRETALRQDIRQTFASLFPGVPIVDPILQWQSQQKNPATQRSGDALDTLYRSAAQLDGELGVSSVSVKDGKVQLVLAADKASPLMSKLTTQGLRVQGNALPDGRFSVEVQP